MATGHGNKHCWSYSLLRCLSTLGVMPDMKDAWATATVVGDGSGGRRLRQINLMLVAGALQSVSTTSWRAATQLGSPRSVPDNIHEGFKTATYRSWFKPPAGFDKKTAFTSHLRTVKSIVDVSRMRMGSHSLDVDARRWGD